VRGGEDGRELAALGRAIRRLRHDRGLSMAALASRAAGVSPKSLNRIELGQANPCFSALLAVSEALGVTFWDLAATASAMTEERELIAFGRAVRQAREERGASVDALATAAGIPSPDIEAIEAGRVDPGYRRLRRLAAALGVTYTALLLRVEEHREEGSNDASL
jgi:transcriptional regulator with XRE-family HTH domain